MNSTDMCIKNKQYRVEKNNFTILYDGIKDEFNLGVKNWNNLNIGDIKDLNNLTRRILRYNEKYKNC